MNIFTGGLILLDIEGTVSPLAFVHDVMFPYARRRTADFLDRHAADHRAAQTLHQMALDAGCASFSDWCPAQAGSPEAAEWVVREVHRLMDADAKLTGLKQLQGLIWEEGFRQGDLRATLFEEVAETLRAWHQHGLQLRIYSSGSVHAQRQFFQHTEAGDLTPLLAGFHDTTTGPKREPSSYAAITRDAGFAPEEILFISDVAEELEAARAANLQTTLAIRPGNRETHDTQHPRIHSLRDIIIP